MVEQLIQFAPLFVAHGCHLNYRSKQADLEISDIAQNADLINAAIDEIAKYAVTSNYVDGAAALVLADTIDGSVNPLGPTIRGNVLQGIGLQREGKFIHPVLMLNLSNKAWHFSATANGCSAFGDECVNRGVNPRIGGRFSVRKPEEYHKLTGKGTINREQLLTANLKRLAHTIPTEALTKERITPIITIDFKRMNELDVEEKLKLIEELQAQLGEKIG